MTDMMLTSLIGLAAKGGWLMIVLLALSIVAIYIFGERWWYIRKAGNVDKNFMKDIKGYLAEGKVRSAKALCKHFNGPMARMVFKGIVRMDQPVDDIQKAMENVANLEVARMEKGLPILSAVSGGAPMIGFLGTVIGMIQAFFNMAEAGNNVDIALLSGGIYTAMITTVGGLIVGILAYFGYNVLVAKIGTITARMDHAIVEFTDAIIAIRAQSQE